MLGIVCIFVVSYRITFDNERYLPLQIEVSSDALMDFCRGFFMLYFGIISYICKKQYYGRQGTQGKEK
jgi:hypothetical protein